MLLGIKTVFYNTIWVVASAAMQLMHFYDTGHFIRDRCINEVEYYNWNGSVIYILSIGI